MLAYVLDERYSFLLLLSKDIEQISGKTELEPRFLSELNPPPSASLELMEWGVKEEGGREMLESYVALVSLVKFILAWKGLNYSKIFKSRLSGRGREVF